MVEIRDIVDNQVALCREVLESLPDWFIPPVIEICSSEAADVTMLGAYEGDDLVGMLTLMQLNTDTFEVRALGVRPEHHRSGAGRALMAEAVKRSKAGEAKLVLVKTIGPSDPNPNFIPTRAFYTAQGFYLLEELPLWGPQSQVAVLVKAI